MRIIPENTRASRLAADLEPADAALGLITAFCLFDIYISGMIPAAKLICSAAVIAAAVLLCRRTALGKPYRLVPAFLRFLAYRKRFVKMQTPDLLVYSRAEAKKQRQERRVSTRRDFSQYDVPVTGKEKRKKRRSRVSLRALGKEYDIRSITPFTKIEDGLIHYGGEYYAAALAISPVNFGFLNSREQNALVDDVLGAALRGLRACKSVSIIKIDRPVLFDGYIESEAQRLSGLKENYLDARLSEEELTSGVAILSERLDAYEYWNSEDRIYKSFYYLVVCDISANRLRFKANMAAESLNSGGLPCKPLDDKELAVFLKYQYGSAFDEREIESISREHWMDWILPERMEFSPAFVTVDGVCCRSLKLAGYPGSAPAAWGARLFDIPGAKVVMKLTPVERVAATNRIEREISRLRSSRPRKRDADAHARRQNGLLGVLSGLQHGEECLFEANTYITLYGKPVSPGGGDAELQRARRAGKAAQKGFSRSLGAQGLKPQDMPFMQFEAYAGSGVSAWDPYAAFGRGLTAAAVAAAFPFAEARRSDTGGINLGLSGGVPVFVDLFKRDESHLNSNIILIGRQGSGKSYAAKSLCANLFAEGARVFALDAENACAPLAKRINGRVVNAFDAGQCRLNPLEIVPFLSANPNGDAPAASYAAQLEFLDMFWGQLFPELPPAARQLLNKCAEIIYAEKNIGAGADLKKLSPGDYPTLEDLRGAVRAELKGAAITDPGDLVALTSALTKLTRGGSGPALWNARTQLSADEGFVAFNCKAPPEASGPVAGAQLLLILRWIEGEIIKNHGHNRRCKAQRKAVVVIDGADAFFDAHSPGLRQYLLRFAGRIALYGGMLALTARSLKAFCGASASAGRAAAALVSACQYSFIFPLSKDDMPELTGLYENITEIGEAEQLSIAANPRGTAFVISGPRDRENMQITAYPEVASII